MVVHLRPFSQEQSGVFTVSVLGPKTECSHKGFEIKKFLVKGRDKMSHKENVNNVQSE